MPGTVAAARAQPFAGCWNIFLGMLALLYCSSLTVHAADESIEYSIKAAYLLKFGEFVEWPPAAFPGRDAPLVIGVLGDDPFGAALDQLALANTVKGRAVVLRRLPRESPVGGVHILFVTREARDRLKMMTESDQLRHVLTVADAEPSEAIINFVIESNRVRFDVNLERAERAGLRISSKLIGVAKAVKARP